MDKATWCLINIGLVQKQIVAIDKKDDLGQHEKQAILTSLNKELKGYEASLLVALSKKQNDQTPDG